MSERLNFVLFLAWRALWGGGEEGEAGICDGWALNGKKQLAITTLRTCGWEQEEHYVSEQMDKEDGQKTDR